MLSGLCYWRWLMYQYLRLWCLCNYVEFVCLWNEIRAWCVRDWLRSRYWTIQSIRWSSSGLHWNDRRCVWLIILIDTNNWDNSHTISWFLLLFRRGISLAIHSRRLRMNDALCFWLRSSECKNRHFLILFGVHSDEAQRRKCYECSAPLIWFLVMIDS